jgi:NAD(P)-dependent dehydrogenase (short-subunit alcohol dehydrogenase family)
MASKTREVIITGASGGIGQGIAEVFVASGWHVIGIDHTAPDSPESFEEFHLVDLSKPDSIAGFFAEVRAREQDKLGTERERPAVRCIVNNAAVQVCSPVHETTLEEWDQVMSVNLRAPYLMIRRGIAWLRHADSASVVNISSVHATATSPSIAAYAASKGGLSALTRAAALDLGPEGIRVNAVAPGAIDTPMLRDGLTRQTDAEPAELLARFAAKQTVGRIGTPTEIGGVVLMLAAPETGGFFNGASVTVDGGATIRLSTE